jgi:hypothetical protein
MIFLTTTAVDIDEELQNRCVVLTIDEGREQTRAIHKMQRELMTLEGLHAQHRKKSVLKLHRNAQRLLKPVKVVNPYAPQLSFLDDRTRTRRDHMKYLTLINAIALLHQYQRPIKTSGSLTYIEVTPDDINVANTLAHEVLGRSLDELSPQTRRLLLFLDEMANRECERLKIDRKQYRFTRKEVREYTRWRNTQLHVHLERLTDLEYVLVHRGGRGRSFEYELLYDGQGKEGSPFLMRLLEVEKLQKHKYDANHSGESKSFSGPIRGAFGMFSGRAELANLVAG